METGIGWIMKFISLPAFLIAGAIFFIQGLSRKKTSTMLMGCGFMLLAAGIELGARDTSLLPPPVDHAALEQRQIIGIIIMAIGLPPLLVGVRRFVREQGSKMDEMMLSGSPKKQEPPAAGHRQV